MEPLQEAIDELKKAYINLWDALLTINGFLITITIGLSVFGGIGSTGLAIRIIAFLSVLLLIVSCYFIIVIYFSYINAYKKISSALHDAETGSIKHEDLVNNDKYTNTISSNHNMIMFAQKFTITSQAFALVLILTLVFYLLFIQKTVSNNQIDNSNVYYGSTEEYGPFKK